MGLISFGKLQKIVFLRSRSRALTRARVRVCACESLLFESFEFFESFEEKFQKVSSF